MNWTPPPRPPKLDLILEFEVAGAALETGRGSYLRSDSPFYLANKARAYSSIVRTGARPYGGKVWRELKRTEAAVTMAADDEAEAFFHRTGRRWPLSGSYRLDLELHFGDRLVEVFPKNRKPYTRRDRGAVRCRKTGLDKASQAILDGLQEQIFHDDEQTIELFVRKLARPPDELGDLVRIRASILRLG